MNNANLYIIKNLPIKCSNFEKKKLNNKSSHININYKKNIFIFALISFASLINILFIVLLLIYKSWNKNKENQENVINYVQTKEIDNINFNDYKNELTFKNKVNDIRRLSIEQKSYEEMIIDGIQTQTKLFRKTIYDIYIISEKNVYNKNKYYYNKIYTASISIVSQCLSTENEDCELKEYVNLSNNNKTNLRNLKEITDLKNIPLYLCLFNLTNTNIITSISCPESLSQSIKNEILSDLYYFRPTAKASTNQKHEMDINFLGEIKIIRKQSKGSCNINNGISSFCNLDMNITKDSIGNLLAFNETSFIDIITDTKNLFKKNKTIKLIDETSQINNLNPDKYKLILENLLLKLNPFLKYEENNSINKTIKQDNSKIIIEKHNNRYLTENNNNNIYKNYIKKENLFFKEIYGTKISLNLKIDPGVNEENMKAISNLKFSQEDNILNNITKFSNLNKIIKKNKIIYNSGNYFAFQLYENLKKKFDNLPHDISKQISNLNNLIIFKDLREFFDSSFTFNKILSKSIIEDSNILYIKLNKIENENDNFKNYSNALKNNINNYLRESYDLMNNIFNNLDNLNNLLNLKKSDFAEIATIYLNNTPNSYYNIILETKNILKDFIEEKVNNINNSIELSLIYFDSNYSESIKEQQNFINKLYYKLDNKSLIIENGEKEDYEQIMNNLYYSNDYINVITNNIKKETRNIFSSNSNYILSNKDKNKYYDILEESIKIASNLDNNELIDKTFDKIMINFKDNFTNILKYMNKLKNEKFPLIDEVLKEELFSSTEKNNIKNKISECGINIINKIKTENNYYINLVKEKINKFLNENIEILNSLILELYILLSDETLMEISYSYQNAFNNTIKEILNDLNLNSLLIQKYYNAYNISISFALKNIKDSSKFKVLSYEKKINQSYFNNYTILKNNLKKLRNYIHTKLYDDFLDEYNNIIAKLKESLLLIKNNKITNIYPGIKQFNFYNKHMNIVDELNERIDKYFSLEIYNKNFLLELNEFNKNSTKVIDNITSFMSSQHSILSKLKTLEEKDDIISNDYYVCFDITCSGKYSFYRYCIEFYYDSDIKENNYSIETKRTFKNLELLDNITSKINEKVNYYNSKINIIKDSLLNLEKEIVDKNITKDYLLPIETEINIILSQKYGKEIIKSSYNYYKNNIGTKIENILNDINNKWNDSFNILEKEISNNISNFKYLDEEFYLMPMIYETLISQNISISFFDSIINLQKNEFNYTISYYYHYLLNLVNSIESFIINNIPTNEMMLYNIIDLRKQEINNELNKIIKKINDSKNDVLNIDNQINILNVEKLDFFGMNSTFINNNEKIVKYLRNKVYKIIEYNNYEFNNKYRIVLRYYLEYSEFCKQINTFYEEIFDKLFIELNKEKLKELINNNWLIDIDDINHRLNISLFNSNQEICKDLLAIIDNYTLEMEKEINKYFPKEIMVGRINELYKNGIKRFDNYKKSDFKNNLYEILDFISENFYNESVRINKTAVSYNSDFSKINDTVKNYQEKIFNETKRIYTNVIRGFRDNVMNNIYKKYIEIGLNEYITECKKYTKEFKVYYLLNSSYNLEEITNNIIEELINGYKQFIIKLIDYKYEKELKNIFDLDELEELINYELDYRYFLFANN